MTNVGEEGGGWEKQKLQGKDLGTLDQLVAKDFALKLLLAAEHCECRCEKTQDATCQT